MNSVDVDRSAVRPQPNPLRTDFAGGSFRSRVLDAAIRYSVRPFIALWSRYPDLPWPYGAIDHLGRVLRTAPGLSRRRIALPHCGAELTTPRTVDESRFVLYLHGGAFLVGNRTLHHQMVGRFADMLGARILAVGYRKMPKYGIAEAVSDCVDGYRHALEMGVAPENVTVMGDSAGGYLVFATALEIRRQGLPMPAAIVAMSPLTDWDHSAKLAAPTGGVCAVFPVRAVPIFGALAERTCGATPLVSPAHADLTGLPPTLIQASSSEFVYPDAELMAERLAAHGVSCELQIWPGQVHVFQAAASIVPEAAEAVREIGGFLDRTLWQRAERRTA
ncbi:alpha/beta hydrolase [Nocardia sp. NPDC050713]|uniref:alpha/beta hydrolase n=1 Tax=Nocardia sp. NPDC050713 TaxID=3154511 RepID=UPI0033C28633